MSTTETTRRVDRTASEIGLFVAFELGEREWKMAWATSLGEKPRLHTVRARGTQRLLEWIQTAQRERNFSRCCSERPWARGIFGAS